MQFNQAQSLHRVPNLSELGDILRGFNPGIAKPQKLDDLWSLLEPVRAVVPELERYDISTADGKREFPRTAASLAILGGLLRASDALKVLDAPVGEVALRLSAAESFMREFNAFSAPQDPGLRISLDQFAGLVSLFKGVSGDQTAVATIALSVIYGDLGKMPEVKERLRKSINADVADHDIALCEAFQSTNISKCSELFPTMFFLPPEYRERLEGEVLSGLNLGHVLQSETGAAALTPLRLRASKDPQQVTFWLLPSLVDILGARAEGSKPETWCGSVLGTTNLIPALLLFSQELPRLSSEGEVAFFDSFQKKLSIRNFYRPIFIDTELNEREKDTLFRLSRFLSWETDRRPLGALIEGFKKISEGDRELLATYFLRTGLTPGEPKPVVTYLPYIFTQLYARHLELPQAISRTLDTVCSLLRRIDESQKATTQGAATGIVTYSAQDLWFKTLRPMTSEELGTHPLHLAIDQSNEGSPEVILESSLLVRDKKMREVLLGCLQSATEIAVPQCASILDRELTPLEREVLAFVNSHNFTDGSWYRPIHNLVVPYAMIQVCKREGASRDLVLAAMLHDIGYAGLNIPGTLEGAAWDTKDMRERHMAAGAVMSERFLGQLISDGKVSLSPERKQKLVEIIATHDDPYIGGSLGDRESLLHRDADRAFVASAVSFYKDYLAYLSDLKRSSRFSGAGIELTLEAFLKLRLASFNGDDGNQMSRFAKLEPMTTETGQAICERQLSKRLTEIATVLGGIRSGKRSESALIALLARIIVDDFRAIGEL